VPGLRSLQARHPDCVRRRARVRARDGRRRTARRSGGQGGAALRRTVRQATRSRVRRRGDRPRRLVCDERREALQVGARRASQAPDSQDPERRRDSRVHAVVGAGDRARSTRGDRLPRSHRGQGAPRPRIQRHEKARRTDPIGMGTRNYCHRAPVGRPSRAAGSTGAGRANVHRRRPKGGAVPRARGFIKASPGAAS